MAISTLPHEVPLWTIKNYVLQNPGESGQSLEIAPLEHINGDEPYWFLWATVHNWQNAYIESFNGRLRDECLNEHWFTSLAHARVVIESWRREYNEERPKAVLDGLTPAEYARRLRAKAITILENSNPERY